MSQATGIRCWPEEDRPREKLYRLGEHKLSDVELLAVIIGSGTRGEDALALSRRIWGIFNESFREMSHTDPASWSAIKGMGEAKIARVRAALEIGRRFREVEEKKKKVKASGPGEVVDILAPRMRDLKKEVFKIVCLDGRNHIQRIEEITEGSPNSANPPMREILAVAIRNFAAGLIAVHNHPSGLPDPSPEDRAFTRQLQDVCRSVGIPLLDHIIIGDGKHFSFSRAGLL